VIHQINLGFLRFSDRDTRPAAARLPNRILTHVPWQDRINRTPEGNAPVLGNMPAPVSGMPSGEPDDCFLVQ